MAITNSRKRAWVDEIIDLRRVEIPAIRRRVLDVGEFLGRGTHRGDTLNLKVVVSPPGVRTGVDWKAAFNHLCAEYGVEATEVARLTRRFDTSRRVGLEVKVCEDHAERKED